MSEPLDIEELERLCEKATPGPWWPGHFTDDSHPCNCRSIINDGYAGGIAEVHEDNGIVSITEGGNDCPPHNEAVANALLIAASRSAVPALILRVKELELERDAHKGNADDNYKRITELEAALAKARDEALVLERETGRLISSARAFLGYFSLSELSSDKGDQGAGLYDQCNFAERTLKSRTPT